VLEAMAYGSPCLASDIPENREALQGHGFVFRNADWRNLLAVLEDLLANPARVEGERGAAAEMVQRDFSWDRIADRMLAFYQAVLGGKRGLD